MMQFDWEPAVAEVAVDWRQDDLCKQVYVDGLKLAVGSRHSYKLCQVRPDWAPVLVIDGIVMHTLRMNPVDYADNKVKPIDVKGRVVLECCSGLGYVTSSLLSRGAKRVVSIEADPTVLQLSRYNVHSSSLGDPRVDLLVSDAVAAARRMRSGAFDVVIHDPPTLKRDTGHLFSLALYLEYARVLKQGGIMYHYLPHPGEKHRNRNIGKGIASRMRAAGFRIVRETNDGLYAVLDRAQRGGSNR